MGLAAKKVAYLKQRDRAKFRGIGWEITFEEWCDWWGEDFNNRGVSTSSLQMCRIADKGPYRLDNIYKGTPKQNQKTRGCVQRNNKVLAAYKAHQEALDNAEMVASDDKDWVDTDEMTISEYYAWKASESKSPSSRMKMLVGERVR